MSENTQGTATGAELDTVVVEGEVLDAPETVTAPSDQVKVAGNWSRKLQTSMGHMTRQDFTKAEREGKLAEYRDEAAMLTAAAGNSADAFGGLRTFAGAYAVHANEQLEGDDKLSGKALAEIMHVSPGRISHYAIAARLHFDLGVNVTDPEWKWTSKQPKGLPDLLKRQGVTRGDLDAFRRRIESAPATPASNSGTATTSSGSGRGPGRQTSDENESVTLPRNRTTAHLHIGQLLTAMESGKYGQMTAEEWATLSQLTARCQAMLIGAPAKVRTDGAAVLAKRTAKAGSK